MSSPGLLPDRLRVADELRPILATPLEDFLAGQERPAAFLADASGWLAGGRGYVAEWQLQEGKLQLTALLRPWGEPSDGLAQLFPNQALPIAAGWYYGEILVGDGPATGVDYLGRITYQRTRLLRIEAGCLVGETTVENSPPGSLSGMFNFG